MRLMLLLIAVTATVAAVLILLPPGEGQRGNRAGFTRPIRRLLRRLTSTFTPETAKTRQHAAELMRQFSALLVSGRGEAQAWSDLRDHWNRRDPEHPFTELCTQVAAAEQAGTGTAHGLRRILATQNQETRLDDPELKRLVNRLLAVTSLSEQTGAPLSGLIEQLAESLDEAAELAGAVETATAGPKLTQLILTLLPIGGLALGQIMGAEPLSLLLSGTLGLACLVVGLLCLMAGRLWSNRMIQGVLKYV